MNKTTKHYFINLFKRKKRILVLYFFVCFMAYPFLLITDMLTNHGSHIGDITLNSFTLAIVVLGILAAVLPIFTFKFSIVKRNVDMYFSIPINRNHLFKAHFIAPILGACLPILVNYLIGGLFLLPYNEFIVYIALLGDLFLAFIIFGVIYSVNSFFVLKSNNIVDACLMTAAVLIVPLMLSGAVESFLGSQMVPGAFEVEGIRMIPNYVLDLLCPYRGLILLGNTADSTGQTIQMNFGSFRWGLFIYYFVIGIFFALVSKISFGKKKGEDAEQLTTHFLTYPLFINAGIISLFLIFNFTEFNDITAVILITIALFVIYTVINGIAQRSMKITGKMIMKFILILVIVNGFNYISRNTEFFGLNRKMIDYKKYDIITVTYSQYGFEKDDYYETEIVIYPKKEMSNNEIKLFEVVNEIQKEKSLAYKEKNDDILYPSGDDDYYLNIYFDYEVTQHNDEDQDVIYNLTEKRANQIKQILENINNGE